MALRLGGSKSRDKLVQHTFNSSEDMQHTFLKVIETEWMEKFLLKREATII